MASSASISSWPRLTSAISSACYMHGQAAWKKKKEKKRGVEGKEGDGTEGGKLKIEESARGASSWQD